MQETNFVLLWQEHYDRIERTLRINEVLLRESISQKARRTLRPFYWIKRTGIVLGLVFLALLAACLTYSLFHFDKNNLYFIISIGAIFLINLKAVIDYLKHLHWASKIDYDGPITSIQEVLLRIRLSIIQHSRVMILQLPFWSTFFLHGAWFPGKTSWPIILFQLAITTSFLAFSIWSYRKLSPKNAGKSWVKFLIAGSGGQQIDRTLELYRDLENFTISNP